jgi:hypothetical protein
MTKRNHYTFGLGTIGRDMLYSLISMYLIFYLTDILELTNATLGWISNNYPNLDFILPGAVAPKLPA